MKITSNLHSALYRCTGGRIGGQLGGLPVLLLTTIGRRTRRRRTTPLVYLGDGEDLVIVGSNGGNDWHPSWYRNLLRNQHAEVQINTQRKRVAGVTATGSERERLWQEVVKLWPGYARYQEGTNRSIPLVVLRDEGPPNDASLHSPDS